MFNTVTEHGHAKWAGDGDGFGPGGRHVGGPFVVDFQSTGFGFFEHLGTARTATQAVALAASHFDQIGIQGTD